MASWILLAEPPRFCEHKDRFANMCQPRRSSAVRFELSESADSSAGTEKTSRAAAEGGACGTVVAQVGKRQNEWADSRASRTVISPQAVGSTS